MKNFKSSPIILFIVFVLIIIYTNIDLAFKPIIMLSKDDTNIIKILENQHYETWEDQKSKYIYVGVANKNTMNFNKYLVKNGDLLKLNLSQNKKIIISLLEDYEGINTWNIKDIESLTNITFIEKKICYITPEISVHNLKDNELDREVIFLETKKKGKDIINFICGNAQEEVFEFQLEVHVE